jgi:hypothetical protein
MVVHNLIPVEMGQNCLFLWVVVYWLLQKLSKLPGESFISAFGRLSKNLCESYGGVRAGRTQYQATG